MSGLFLWGTWFATLVVTIGVIHAGGDAVFAGGGESYGIGSRIDVISSGVGRWGAVCAIICLVTGLYVRSLWLRAALLGATLVGLDIVYKMQSRGAIFGSAAALLFLVITEKRVRRWALPLLIVGLVALYASNSREDVLHNVMAYLARGGGDQGLYTMTGRTAYWDQGWQAFQDAPLIGRGQWADRLLGIGHIHNSFLQSLLNSGVLGFIPYLLSWIAAWRLFLTLWNRRSFLRSSQQLLLSQCGAVLAFYTMRAIPETTTASYSPDLLMLLAVYVFMESTAREMQRSLAVSRRYVLAPIHHCIRVHATS